MDGNEVALYAAATAASVEAVRRIWPRVDGPWVAVAAIVAGVTIALLARQPHASAEWYSALSIGFVAGVSAVGGVGVLARIASKASMPVVVEKPTQTEKEKQP